MPTKTDVAHKKGTVQQTEIESDFQTFFNECSGSNLSKFQLIKILWPLKFRIWKEWAMKYGIAILLMITFVCMAFYVDFLTWNFAAVGRLSLGKLRSVWDWESLYKAKCLVGKSLDKNEESLGSNEIERKFLDYKDCVVCENIDKIPRLSNVKYHDLHDKYLLRGRPALIITDSHNYWPKHENFASYLSTLPGLVHAKPCELQTNLMLYKSIDLKTLLLLAAENIEIGTDQWFLHFRNCDFDAVKASRAFIPKPYFYSSHLEPPYTSWILLSENYKHGGYKDLSLLNMVIIQQLSGILEVLLEAKGVCYDVCGTHHVKILESETLVFMSKLWNFKYLPSANDLSVTVVTETYFL